MNEQRILTAIDSEIGRLQQVRALLTGTSTSTAKNGAKPGVSPKKRILSAEAREKIAAAQRKRWAAKKKAPK